MKPNEIYDHVTQTIIEHLNGHLETWDRPWITLGQDGGPARNPSRKDEPYRGINQFILSLQMLESKFIRNQWLTFKQSKDMGGHVRKGEKSTPVVFYKTGYVDKNKKYYSKEQYENASPDDFATLGLTQIPILKLYRVFNVAQINDLDPSFYEVPESTPLSDFEKDERAEALIYSTGATINVVASNRAFYNYEGDSITVPLREQFRSETQTWYGVVLHEKGHWTGHEKRLNRTFGKTFGDQDYAKEELVAELTSAFCCASLGFTKTISRNAAYIKNWLGVLKADPKAIFTASAAAQRAADYILNGGDNAQTTNPEVS